MLAEFSIRKPLFRWVQQQTGLYITRVNQDPLLLALKVLASECGESQDGYAAQLINGLIDPQPFIDAITTHESFFLRHRRHMEVAITEVIQPLLHQGIRPRVLSAPCAQGEEPYSFAMLLQDCGISPDRVEIAGCDIAASSIQQAKRGEFQQYSLRQVPAGFVARHFQKGERGFKVHSVMQQVVQFSRLNILTESLAKLVPGFHLIFSHNMLIYFDQQTREEVIGVFDQLLAPQGRLFVDTTEVPHVKGVFEGETLKGVRCFLKHGQRREATHERRSVAVDRAPLLQPRQQNREQKFVPVVDKRSNYESTPKKAVIDRKSIAEERRRSAEAAYRNKQFEEAIRLYDQLIEHHPLWASWARLGKARVLIDSGQEMEALEEAEGAISGKRMVAGVYLTPSDEADANAIIALVMNNKGLKGRMEEHLKKVKQLNPQHEVLKISL